MMIRHLITVLIILSFSTQPLTAQSPEEDTCCPNNECSWKGEDNRNIIIGGAAVAGGIIGAIIGSISKGDHKQGSRGKFSGSESDPSEEVLFVDELVEESLSSVIVEEDTLDFIFHLNGGEFTGVIAITPFVSSPDSQVYEGETIEVTGPTVFPDIHLKHLHMGTYQAGFRVSSTEVVSLDLSIEVSSSANEGSNTYLGSLNLVTPGSPTESQFTFQFTYDLK